MASASEAEVAALFMNAREAIPFRQGLIEMGHPQPATPMKTDNSTATSIINKTIKQKRSKAIDMRFYWLCDRVTQGMFNVYWEPGLNNLADYPTKHHSGTHHKAVCGIYLYQKDSPRTVKGCIELLNYEKRPRSKNLPTTGTTIGTTIGRSKSGATIGRSKSETDSGHRMSELGKALSTHTSRPIRVKPRLDNPLAHSQSRKAQVQARKTQSMRQSRLNKRSSYNCGQLYSDPINQPLRQ